MRKELIVVFLAIVLLIQGCATIGDKKTASASITQGCEVYCEASKTLEECERESQEFFGFHCEAVYDPEWARERFPMRKTDKSPTAMEVMKSRIGFPPAQGVWTIRRK